MNEYVLMIGSNTDAKKNIEKAIDYLKQTFGIVCLSQQLQTKAENMSNKLPYINVAAKITSQSDEIELKQTLKSIERELGRTSEQKKEVSLQLILISSVKIKKLFIKTMLEESLSRYWWMK